MSDPATLENLRDTLHQHDKRLVRVETEMHGIHNQVETMRAEMTTLRREVGRVVELVGEQRGKLTIIFWILTIGLPAIAALELWDRLIP